MTDEAKKHILEWQEECCENLKDYTGGVLSVEDQREILELLDKSQKILIEDEKMKLEIEKQKTEAEKLETQKQKDAIESKSNFLTSMMRFAPEVFKEVVDIWFKSKSLAIMSYGVEADQYGCISGKTTRNLFDWWTRPGNH